MAINFTQSFNAGELSRKLDGRNNLEIYKTGCRELSNFLVLPQGGVERRAGTEFVSFTASSGTNPAKLIEFDFSSDTFFVIELGTDYAKVHYTDGNNVNQVQNVTETDAIDYTLDELRLVQYNRKYDTLILTCPTKETMVLTRDTIAPSFSIKKINYLYPPLIDRNITSTTITPSAPATSVYTGTTTLTPSSEIFNEGHVGSIWAIDYLRSVESKEVSETFGSSDGTSLVFSSYLDVSFSSWVFETSGTFQASLLIQKSIAGATETSYVVIGDTRGGVERNFKYISGTVEDANTRIRVAVQRHSSNGGDVSISLEADNIYHRGLVKINSLTSDTPKKANCTIISTLQGGASAPPSTLDWSEPAFSGFRGFSPASEFFENRLFLAGSKDEPADLFASVFNDPFNFDTGNVTNLLSTDAIKRTIDSPEEPKWLEGKRYLFLGTAGSAVSIRSADKDSLIKQSNITTLVENAYGAAPLQAEIANDVIVYVQRDKLKLRELVYVQGEDTFVGNDLNIFSEDITSSGVAEMYVQKEPNQFIWCIKEDGNACILTYERGQEVKGWAKIVTDGEIYSGASIHGSGEDVVWICVKRNEKYCIEKFHLRKDLNWYVDSGKELNGGAAKSITDIAIAVGKITFTSTSHGLSDGDLIQINNTDSNQLNEMTYKISDSTTNTFKIKDIELTDYIFYDNTNDIIVSNATVNTNFNGTYERKLNSNGDVFWQNKNFPSFKVEMQELPALPPASNTFSWHLIGDGVFLRLGSLFNTKGDLLKNLWWDINYDNSNFKKAFVNAIFKSEAKGEVIEVYNEISSLDHINGKTVQVLGNDSFITETTVTNNKVTLDNYYNKILVGLKYTSTLKPMPIEPTLVSKLPQSRVKATAKIIVNFLNTKGASVGEAGRQLSNLSVLDTQNITGQPLPLETGQQRFFVASDYEREKLIEIKQDLPYPMTILSIASHINVEGA